ncbi:BMP family ABC transporter substrate-binding protein [Mycoplasmatota bacterium]|nr:BMP family ABC transporter substrate-binding protein [Mycoplasmatota bacterium]
MKRKLLLVVVLAFAAIGLAACGGNTYEIALITDKGDIDDKSFNQGAWEGVVAYAEENNISHQYYKPAEATDDAYLDAISDAVDAGAEVIVTPGFLFEVPVYSAQTLYPEVTFILLDGAPHTADYGTFNTESNVASIFYAEEESGWLAGYAAVMDGMTELGFMGGMAVPAVQAFGYGFLQGAEYAAVELDVDVNAIYHYTGDFDETDTNKATAAAMYQGGTEVIFAAGGYVGKSVMSAAAEAEALVIGVDVDQRYDSETVVTSATKGLAVSVQLVLDAYYDDSFDTYGGKSTYFDATNDGVGLPTMVIGDDTADAFDRFDSFDEADYDAAFALLVNGTVDPLRTITIADTDGVATAAELVSGLSLTRVTVVSR